MSDGVENAEHNWGFFSARALLCCKIKRTSSLTLTVTSRTETEDVSPVLEIEEMHVTAPQAVTHVLLGR